MSPIEQIKNGISHRDWEMVCKGYRQLTGKTLVVPQQPNKNIEDLEDTLELIADIISNVIGSRYKKRRIKVSKKKRRVKTSKGTNQSQADEDQSIVFEGDINTPMTPKPDGVRHITNQPDQEEVEHNRQKAQKRGDRRLRPTILYHNVRCNECEKEFKSRRPPGDIGQKCSECLKAARNRSKSNVK